MFTDFRILKTTRENILKLVEAHDINQLNDIPTGFNNNLIWNFAHIVVTQQLLCYGLSGLDMYTENEMVTNYRKGSKPDRDKPVAQDKFNEFRGLARETIDLIEKDYRTGKFENYKVYTSSYNMTLNNVEEAIRFNNVHEAMHLGSCLALSKFV